MLQEYLYGCELGNAEYDSWDWYHAAAIQRQRANKGKPTIWYWNAADPEICHTDPGAILDDVDWHIVEVQTGIITLSWWARAPIGDDGDHEDREFATEAEALAWYNQRVRALDAADAGEQEYQSWIIALL